MHAWVSRWGEGDIIWYHAFTSMGESGQCGLFGVISVCKALWDESLIWLGGLRKHWWVRFVKIPASIVKSFFILPVVPFALWNTILIKNWAIEKQNDKVVSSSTIIVEETCELNGVSMRLSWELIFVYVCLSCLFN